VAYFLQQAFHTQTPKESLSLITRTALFLTLPAELVRPSFPEGTHIFLLKNCSARLSQAARGFRKGGLWDF